MIERVTAVAAASAVLAGGMTLVTSGSAEAIPNADFCATRAEGDQIKRGMTIRQVRRVLDGQRAFYGERIVGGTTGRRLFGQMFWGCPAGHNMYVAYNRGTPHRVVAKPNVLWI